MTDSKKDKLIKQYKSEAKEATDAILMNVIDQGMRDFSEYKDDVMDWSWDSIINQ